MSLRPFSTIGFGAAAAALTYNKSPTSKLLRATLAGVGAVYICSVSKATLGLEREASEIEEWLAQHEEDAVDPEIRVFDAHHHLWDFGTRRLEVGRLGLVVLPVRAFLFSLRPKLRSAIITALARVMLKPSLAQAFSKHGKIMTTPYMAEDMLKDIRGVSTGGHDVVGTMYVECGSGYHPVGTKSDPGSEMARKCMAPTGEAAFVEAVRRAHPNICQGMIAHADLSQPEFVEEALRCYKEQFPFVKGIRDTIAGCDDPEMGMPLSDKADSEAFRKGFSLLQKYGFVYESWHFHVNLDAFERLATAFPQQIMVCNHIGYPLHTGNKYTKEASFPEWKVSMTKLAKCKNVYVKVGGLGTQLLGFKFEERSHPPTSDELAAVWGPYVKHTIEAFGADRCIMESNFPVDKISCGYTVYFNALKKIVKEYSKEDKRKLFELNALRLYGISL